MAKVLKPNIGTNRILAVLLCYNTDKGTRDVLGRFPLSGDRGYDVVVVNDGSTDYTAKYISEYADRFNFNVISHERNIGVGRTIKSGIRCGMDNGYKSVVILAGNGKDDPKQIPRFISTIEGEEYDYVQGSRFLSGGRWDNLPLFRYVMVKVHAFLFTILTGRKCTDALNGFRAYKLSIFKDPRINIWQDWLDRYEFETYLHYKVLRCGYKFKEVAVSKIYPREKNVKYSHIRPIIDWWSIMKPLLYLILGLRR